MVNYLKEDYLSEIDASYDLQTYFPGDVRFRTEVGVADEGEIPILNGDDNIFSEISLPTELNKVYQKAADFIAEFTRVFVRKKVSDRAYNKFVQNKNELPDVELDWIFQYFRVSFLFSTTEDDYYCITKYDVNTRKYESKIGPLERDNYKTVAEEVMQEVE